MRQNKNSTPEEKEKRNNMVCKDCGTPFYTVKQVVRCPKCKSKNVKAR